jgi:Protein of unknown function, DUF417
LEQATGNPGSHRFDAHFPRDGHDHSVHAGRLALIYAGFWDKRFGVLGSLGSTITFATTVTIIPFMPNGWDPSAGFPAMADLVPFLMKDFVPLAVSIYLLKQDVARVIEAGPKARVELSKAR